jgi:hypothetical protein
VPGCLVDLLDVLTGVIPEGRIDGPDQARQRPRLLGLFILAVTNTRSAISRADTGLFRPSVA